MKVICESKRVVNTVESCKKEYCCKQMELAMNKIVEKCDTYYPNIAISNDVVELETHHSYDVGSKETIITFCPFCGIKISVKHESIDSTNLPATEIVQVLEEQPKKKKHWWN